MHCPACEKDVEKIEARAPDGAVLIQCAECGTLLELRWDFSESPRLPVH